MLKLFTLCIDTCINSLYKLSFTRLETYRKKNKLLYGARLLDNSQFALKIFFAFMFM